MVGTVSTEQLESREKQSEEARLAYVVPAPRPPREYYLGGAVFGAGFGALVVFSGFWNALLIGGFTLAGLLLGHLVRLTADGRVDLGGAWRVLTNHDEDR